MKYYLILNQDGLVYYVKKRNPEYFNFPPQAVHHQEIIDHKLFEEFLNTFFIHVKKKDAILFLSDELIYSYAIPLSESFLVEEEQKKFADTLPFSSEAIETIHIKTKTDMYFFAVNSDLYKTLLMVAHNYESTINYVLPLLLFGQGMTADQLTFDMLTKFTKQKDLVLHGDFLQNVKMHTNHHSILKQVLLLIFSLCAVGGALLWAINSTNFLQ